MSYFDINTHCRTKLHLMGYEIPQAFWYFVEGFACLLCLKYPLRWIQHDVDTDDGLLVLVDQTHQLLCIISLHQHDGTGKGVGLPQLCVMHCVQNKKRSTHRYEFLFISMLQRYFWSCLHTHLSSSIGVITDIKNNSLSSFIQSHASLNKQTNKYAYIKLLICRKA